MDPDSAVTLEAALLRNIEHSTRMAVWAQTEDAQRGRNQPEPLLLFASEREAAEKRAHPYDQMTIDEAREWLGWD